jgi:lysyl-tRNA synthetase, class II
MTRTICQFLRPALSKGFRPVTKPEHARAYLALQRSVSQSLAYSTAPGSVIGDHSEKNRRLQQLESVAPLNSYHPRLTRSSGLRALSPKQFREEFGEIASLGEDVAIQVFGMLS